MRTRKEIEELEDKVLAPYAMRSKDSNGRKYDEPQHDVRTCYQRDRDRIVHSEAFRKLEYKTQVFVIFEGDYYRTRLTHTIEVAQIARTIGRNLRLNEDLIEAIALAHDLGHPPFGHAGEMALNDILQEASNKKWHFNHNFRSYEIVSIFEKRYPDFPGLNLTEEVKVGILKHETTFDVSSQVKSYEKVGPTLEARVVDVADALAYLSHDIDDGLTSGCITKDDLMDSKLWRESYQKIQGQLDPDDKEMLKYQVVKYLIDSQTKDLLKNSSKNLKQKSFKSSEEAKKYQLKHPKERIVGFSPKMDTERTVLQDLLFQRLYQHYRVVRMTERANRVIKQIFGVYSDNPDQLPYDIWTRPKAPDKKAYPKKYEKWNKRKYEIICNYIAGMTDRFALDEYKKLFDPYEKV